ncbi:MAG: HNH endonuclease [Bacteriovoracaceae bacterium]|nr:HNH endonuclease [Bacteriovoracaceae bacterium]
MRTLLLDNTYLPVKIIAWEKAMILFLTGRAEVIEEYANLKIRSPQRSFQLPKILRLFNRNRTKMEVKFNRNNVFYRDNYTCQYCHERFAQKDLTLDHVIPRSKGGASSWENVVTCCSLCNHKKGNKLPEEFAYRLLKKPTRPRWSAHLVIKPGEDDPQEWDRWLQVG